MCQVFKSYLPRNQRIRRQNLTKLKFHIFVLKLTNFILIKPQVRYESVRGKPYQEVWDDQSNRLQLLVHRKLALRNGEKTDPLVHHLMFCEHSPVFTLGKSGSMQNLLLTEQELSTQGIEFFKINRGGDITYHGPGQITGYPIFDLDDFFTDIHRYVRTIEQAVIDTLLHYDIIGYRVPEYTGVWVGKSSEERKICAIGVHMSRWITMHGFALNVNTDLDYFDKIVPCGISDKAVTSLQKEVGKAIDIQEVMELLKYNFSVCFDFEYIKN